MRVDYTNDEVREIVENHRDGESLEEFETRMATRLLDQCRRDGKDPAQLIRERLKGLKGIKRDF